MPAQRLLLWHRRGPRQAPAARAGRGPVDPPNGGIGNAILRFPLDLSAVEDYFIPSNGLFLDNVRAAHLQCLLGGLAHLCCMHAHALPPVQCSSIGAKLRVHACIAMPAMHAVRQHVWHERMR